MSEYQLVFGFSGVRRLSDNELIPVGDNAEWRAYCRWLAAGGKIEGADEGIFIYRGDEGEEG